MEQLASLPQSIFIQWFIKVVLILLKYLSIYLYSTNNICSSHVIGQNLSLISIAVSLKEAKESSAFDLSITILSNLTCLIIDIDHRWHFKMILLQMMIVN